MKNLFIDTNVWLSLYHFTNDDLAQFSKLKDLIGSEIRLFVPQQVSDEISRNRKTRGRFSVLTLSTRLPSKSPDGVVYISHNPEAMRRDLIKSVALTVKLHSDSRAFRPKAVLCDAAFGLSFICQGNWNY